MKSKGGTRVSVMGQGSAGSALKGMSAVLAGQGYAPSLSAQMSALAGVGKLITAADVATSVAKASMLGRLEGLSADASVSVVNRLISSSGVHPSLTPTIYEAVTSILRENAAATDTGYGVANEDAFGLTETHPEACRLEPAIPERFLLQLLLTVLYCAKIAELQLSQNELTKILFGFFGILALPSAFWVWSATGRGHDRFLSPPDLTRGPKV